MRLSLVLPTLAAALAVAAAPAHADDRHASPSGSAAAACTVADPCSIETAINDAVSGDEVIVAPGTYSVTKVLAPKEAIDIHGVAGQPRPRLTGASDLSGSTLLLKNSDTVSHLEIRATSPSKVALEVKNDGAVVDRVLVWAAARHGAMLDASASTVLRDSVVQTDGSAAGVFALKLVDAGAGDTIEVTNVTAWAPSATGIGCDLGSSTALVRNTVARGGTSDIDAAQSGASCSVSNSNFRLSHAPGVGAGTGNQQGDPALTQPGGNDFYPTAASPLIDAGAGGAFLGTLDLAGRNRSNGAVDIGAYEHHSAATVSDPASAGPLAPSDVAQDVSAKKPPAQGTPAAETPPMPTTLPAVPPATLPALPPGLSELPPGVTPPVIGRTVVLAPGGGRVLVKLAGKSGFTPLRAGDDVPVGATIDARAGSVRLSSALGGTRGFQTGTFSGGRFEVRQPRDQQGMTEVILRGGDFSTCPKRSKARAAGRRKPVRRIWGEDDGGRFRTRGAASVATVRGTRWLTEDHCHGTLTKVVEGAVDVRNLRTGATSRVRAGGQKLVRRAR